MKTLISQEDAKQNALEVGELLTTMIQLGGIYFVDDMGFVRSRNNPEEAVPVEIDGVVKKLMIYRDNIPNPEEVVVLNPFSEGQSTSQEKTWFYCTMSIIFSNVVKIIIKNIIEKGLMIKDPTKAAAEDPAFVTLLSTYVEEVDNKMLSEIDSIMGNNPSSFITIYYHARTKTAHLKLGLKESDFKDAFPKVRKKTWQFLEKIITNIFGMNPSYLDYTSNSVGCPHFDAYVHVWYRVYKAMNVFLPFVGINFEEEAFQKYLEGEKIEQYHKHTRWLIQPNVKNANIGGKTIVNGTSSTPQTKSAPSSPPWMAQTNSTGTPIWKQVADTMQNYNRQQQMMWSGAMTPNMFGAMSGYMGQPQVPINMMNMTMHKTVTHMVPGYPGL